MTLFKLTFDGRIVGAESQLQNNVYLFQERAIIYCEFALFNVYCPNLLRFINLKFQEDP